MAETYLINQVIYRRTDDRALIPLTSPTTQLGANSTGSALAVAIGFTFHFDHTAFTAVDLFAYGFARFAGAENTATNSNLYAANTSVLLAPWWDNLETADTVGYIKTELQGTAPFRRFVVEWYVNAQAGQTATDYDRLRFQLVLYESSDRFEFRYADLVETLGAPARGAYSASVGAKGDTSGTPTNRRDYWVTDTELGGSYTTTTANISAATDWPDFTIVTEPAWPMCGRLLLLDQDDIHGMQDPYAEPIWYLANAVNWLWCNHRPALINFSPVQQSAYISVEYVLPATTSLDDLDYVVYVQTYTAGGGDLQIEIDKGRTDDGLQPTSAGWTNLATETALGTAAGWHEWPSFEITPGPGILATSPTQLFRVRLEHLGGSTAILSSVLVVPKALASIHDWFAKATVGSGFKPMSIAQVRLQGASIHPELYNRAWQDIACVLRDRAQMVMSMVWPEGKTTTATTARPRRTLGVTPAQLGVPADASGGWQAQKVTVRAYASDTTTGATRGDLTVSEQGGSSVTFEVPGDSTYAVEGAELDLVSGQPTFLITGKPIGTLRPMSVCAEWVPELGDRDLIVGVTPPPKLEYLVSLKARIERALTAYAMTGLATLLARGKTSSNHWRVQYQVPPAVKALRVKLARVTADTTVETEESSVYGVSSGSAPQDEVVIPAPYARGIDDIPPEGSVSIVAGAQTWQTAPASPMDRLLESPTETSMIGPERERLEVLRGVGITLVPIAADAGSL